MSGMRKAQVGVTRAAVGLHPRASPLQASVSHLALSIASPASPAGNEDLCDWPSV